MQNPVMLVDETALFHNLKQFYSLLSPSVKLCAVVKADAYGHGAETISALLEECVDMFAVSTVNEGCSLRVSGVKKDILTLTPPVSPFEAARAKAYDLILSAGDERSLALCREGKNRVHIALNTGMNRYGFDPNALKALSDRGEFRSVRVEGAYSHLYRAEKESVSKKQREIFLRDCEIVSSVVENPIRKHLAATGGILRGRDYHFDMVRLGIGLYGYLPYQSRKVRLKRAMKVFAPVVSSSCGVLHGCGYGEGKGVSTVRFGYADGLFKRAGLGKNGLCMDAFVSEKKLSGMVPVMEDADSLAKRMGTIPYEVLCSFGERVERIYVGRKESVKGADEAHSLRDFGSLFGGR